MPSGAQPPRVRQEEEQLNLAMKLHLQGRLRDAENLCLKVLSANPRNARALYISGRIHLERENIGLAEKRFELAVKESPREPLFLVGLGHASRHDAATAIKLYQKALSIRPELVEAIYSLACLYVKTARADEALGLFDKVLRLDSKHDAVRWAKADALIVLGQVEEADALLRESIRLRKAVGPAYGSLASRQKFSSEPPELGAILQELQRGDLKPSDKPLLHHAAGKILNDLKRYGEAFDQFEKGNLAIGGDFDIDAYRQTVDGAIEVFSPALLNAKAGFGDVTEVPVFILGMPRSGTTLTEQICSSHPDVFGAGELRNLRRTVRRAGLSENSLADFRSAMAAMTLDQSRKMASEYLRDVLRLAPNALRITDKMPQNFELIGFIALLFPKARIIHCRRDPIDTCVSCYMTSFKDTHGYKSDLTRLGLYYREYDRWMRHWNSVLPGRIYEVRYETLIADREIESRKLIDHLGLPWDDACMRFEDNDRLVSTASRWQVRQPIYTSSVKRWKNYEHKIQPLIDALGDLAEI